MSKKITDLTAIAVLASDDILPLVDFDVTTTKKMTVDDFFNFIPSGVNVGLGAGAFDNWGFRQLWETGSPAANYNCGGMYPAVVFNPDADNNNDAYGLYVTIRPTTSGPVGGYPTGDITGVHGYARNTGENTELDKMFGGSFEGRQYGGEVGEIYALMAQATNLSSNSAATTKITGIYADAYTAITTGSVAVGTLYGTELRTFGKTMSSDGASAVTTAYGLYSALYNQQATDSVSTIGDAYNIYVTPYRPDGFAPATHGLIDNYYGLYIVDPVDINATNRWSVYVQGRSHFDQPTTTAAVPVLALDQADESEGFIDYLGTSAASATGPVSSWTTGNSIQGFVRVEINGAAYWMPYYDAPTS